MTVRSKFMKTRTELAASLVERDEEIDLALTALVAKQHLLLVGPPGCAKSLLLDSLMKWAAGKPVKPGDLDAEMTAALAAGKAAAAAAEEVKEYCESREAGMGPGGAGEKRDPKAIAEAYKRVRNNPTLRRISELAGRFRRVAQSKQRMKTTHGFDDMVGVEPGGDIGRLLPHELAKLGVEDLELDTLRRIVERQALCREYAGCEPAGKGPIVITLDESGSMRQKIDAAKGLALALAWIAKQQKRWCALVAYSGSTGERVLALPPGKWDDVKLCEWLVDFIGGGSEIDVPIAELPRMYADLKPPMAHNNLGNALNRQGKVDEGIACYKKAIELDPKLAMAHYNLGRALKNQGKLDEAIACIRMAIELDPKLAAAHCILGIILNAQNKPAEAIVCFRKAIELEPNDADYHTSLGAAFRDKGKLDEAIAAHRKAIELKPDLAVAHINLGAALSDLRKVDEAIACYRKAIELDPKDAMAHRNLGSNLAIQEKLDEAIACFRKALELNPKDPIAQGYLARALNLLAWRLATSADPKVRDAGRALGLAKEAAHLTPKNWTFWNTLGVAHYRVGEWKAALDALQQSMDLHKGGDAKDWFFLAMAHWQLKQKDEARTFYDRAIAWMEKNQEALKTNRHGWEELNRFRIEAAELLEIEKK